MATQAPPSSFPGGFASGFVVRNVPLTQTNPGLVWWVSNNTTLPTSGTTATSSQRIPFVTGSDGNKGTWQQPFATLNYAITQASPGDIIFVKPGHAETISTAAGVNASVAGVAIIGLGNGSLRPTFTLSAQAATIQVSAANVTFQNLLFIGSKATPFNTTCFSILTTVVATDLTIDSCEFRDSSATTGFLQILKVGGSTANTMDGLTFSNNVISHQLTTVTNVVAPVVMVAATDRLTITNNFVVQNTANNNVANLVAFGANNMTNLRLGGNKVYTANTDTATGGWLYTGGSTGSSGLVYDNYGFGFDVAAAIIGDISTKLGFIQNFWTGDADTGGYILPGIGTN